MSKMLKSTKWGKDYRQTKTIEAVFNYWAPNYCADVGSMGYTKVVVQFVKQHLQAGAILDVGCGPGTIGGHFTGSNKVTGVDLSTECLKSAKAKGYSRTVQYNLLKKWPGLQAPNVICTGVIGDYIPLKYGLREIKNNLRKDSILLISIETSHYTMSGSLRAISEMGFSIIAQEGPIKFVGSPCCDEQITMFALKLR